MNQKSALRVQVSGELPHDVLRRIADTVADAVRREVASIDLLSGFTETPPSEAEDRATGGERVVPSDPSRIVSPEERELMGIVYWPPEE